jgi:hypothetical protein
MKFALKLSSIFSLVFAIAIPAMASVTVNNPANSAEVASPFNLSANAATCSTQTVGAMGYSLDNSSDTTIVDGTFVDASVTSSAGTHTLHVKAWGEKGSACVTDVVITVAAAGAILPSDAISVSSIQALSNWKDSDDAGTPGSASGITSLANSPSLSGSARKFVTTLVKEGGERYYVSFGDDQTSTNFLYDTWVYLTTSATAVANVEMDMNQVMSNGQTVIFGFQCDGWAGTWDYTANAGTAAHPIDEWVHSKAGCRPQSWTKNAWHHIQISYSRNDLGVVTYQSVWLDGVEAKINATVPSAFALGWSPTLLTNFQIDGLNVNAANTVYMDKLTISRW